MPFNIVPSQGLIPASHVAGARSASLRIPARSAGQLVKGAALQAGFRKVHFESGERGTFAGSRRSETQYIKTGEVTLLVHWAPVDRWSCIVEWVAYRQEPAMRIFADLGAMSLFEGNLNHAISRWLPPPPPPIKNPQVLPGGEPPTRYRGQIFDYSHLATELQLQPFERGVLPFGFSAFGSGKHIRYGKPLFMPRIGSSPGEELGVLIIAPSGSGKTYLLVRWAAAAIRDKRSVLLVDVKGNLRKSLDEALTLAGVSANILQFTTAKHGPSDRINFLQGISAEDIDCTEQFDVFATALIPSEQFKADSSFVYDIATRIATACFKLLKLKQWFAPDSYKDPSGRVREVDLTDVLDLVEREETVMECIDWIREEEKALAATPQPGSRPNYSVEECVSSLAVALGSTYPTVLDDEDAPDKSKDSEEAAKPKSFRGGQRAPLDKYVQWLMPLIKALGPFRSNGPIGPRVRSFGPGREFRLDEFGQPGQPLVVILSAREENPALAAAVMGMAIRRLRGVLDTRRNQPGALGKVLLLLDETARIPAFDVKGWVTMMRDNQVGYVLVYQRLGMIRKTIDSNPDPDYVDVVMSNVGTQIYLNAITSRDLTLFNQQLYTRKRERELANYMSNPEGRQSGSTLSVETVPFLEDIAAYDLPGGHYPALVYVRDTVPPFLVDRIEPTARRLLEQESGDRNR